MEMRRQLARCSRAPFYEGYRRGLNPQLEHCTRYAPKLERLRIVCRKSPHLGQ